MQSPAAPQTSHPLESGIRPAVAEMAPIASRLIYATMGIVADYLLGNGQPEQAQALVCRLFQLRNNIFSYGLAHAVVIAGEPVGLLLGAPWRLMRRLRLPTAFHIARTGGMQTLLRVLARSASLACAKEADGDEYFVAHIALLPEFQCRGLGTLLMGHAAAKARQLGCMRLALTVATDNRRALSFYRRLDFEVVGTSKFPVLEERIGYPGFHRLRKSLV